MNTPTLTLSRALLRDILVFDVGIDPDALAKGADATLADLGLDSLAQVELTVVLGNRHGIDPVPEAMGTMTFDELAGRLCEVATARSGAGHHSAEK